MFLIVNKVFFNAVFFEINCLFGKVFFGVMVFLKCIFYGDSLIFFVNKFKLFLIVKVVW